MLSSLAQLLSSENTTIIDVIFLVIAYAVLIFVCLPVHEFAHAFAAYKMGDDTAKWHGRLTLDPMKHLDVFGTLMLVVCGFGYAKPVPVNPINFRNYRKGMALTSLAGPLSNLLMAILAVVIYRVITLICGAELILEGYQLYYNGPEQYIDLVYNAYRILIGVFASINLSLAVFNLLPIPPLDGSKIFSYILPGKWSYTLDRYSNYITIGLMVLLFTGALDVPLDLLRRGFGFLICTPLGMSNLF